MGTRYVGLYQAVAGAMMELLVVCSVYKVCGVIPSSSRDTEGPGDGL